MIHVAVIIWTCVITYAAITYFERKISLGESINRDLRGE